WKSSRNLRSCAVHAQDLGHEAPSLFDKCVCGDGSGAAVDRERFLVRGNSGISLSGGTCGRALCKNRHPGAANHGTVCWWMRSCLWCAVDHRIANPARSDCAAHRHQCCNCFDQSPGASRSWLLGFLADETAALWFLEHDARGEKRFFLVAWSCFSTYCLGRAILDF